MRRRAGLPCPRRQRPASRVVRFAISYQPAHHGADPARLVAYARHADECGFEGLYPPEHVALHPGMTLGTFELAQLSAFAARFRLG